MAMISGIIRSYLETYKDEHVKLRYRKALHALLQTNDSTMLHSLNYYLNALYKTDEVLIDKEVKDKIKIKRRLLLTYLLLLQNNDYDKYNDAILRCEELIDYINFNDQDKKSIESFAQQRAYPGKPASYCGIEAGYWMGERILELVTDKTKAVVSWMSAINEKRLYWVWGGGLLRTVLSLLPTEFYNILNAKDVATAPSRFTGYMSWTLYYARFALNAFLLIKDTFAPPMTAKERELGKIDYWERFKTQWDIRKFTLLNDSIWGIANMVCFFWFRGSDGDALTIALLGFDLFIAIWDFEEQKTIYNKKMLDYEIQIHSLRMELHETTGPADINALLQQIHKLEKEQSKSQRDWDNKKITLISGVAYALSLMIAFTLLTMPFLPIPAATLVIIGVIGAILCFALTVIYNAIKGGLEIRTANLSAKEAKMELTEKIKEFKVLLANQPDLDSTDKIFLFLEIKQSLAETEYQKQMVQYQTMHLIRNILIQSIIPALMFVSLVFLPLGVGFGVLGAALALAVVTNLIIEKTFKPDEVHFPEFDNEEYVAFCKDPDKWITPPNSHTLFGKSKARSSEDEVPLLKLDGSPSS